MNAFELVLVFSAGKIAVLSAGSLDWTPRNVIAYFWQDLAVALALASLMGLLRQIGVTRLPRALLCCVVVTYVAINVPVGRTLFTPITWTMLRAARGPLVDSFWPYLTATNITWMAVVLCAAGTTRLLRFLSRTRGRHNARWQIGTRASIALCIPIIVLGPLLAKQTDTLGLDRNVLVALALSAGPHVAARTLEADWRSSPFDHTISPDLASLRGSSHAKNVFLIGLESTAAQYLPLYGAADDVAPNLSALARDAIVFRHAYAVYPESIKGLISVLCSRFPAFDSTAEMHRNEPCHSPAAMLGSMGYDTALFHSGRFDYLGMRAVVQNAGYETLEDAGSIGGDHASSFGVDEASTIRRMLAWIDGLPADGRFVLTYLPIAGHHPYETATKGPFSDRDEIGRYKNALWDGDRSLGALIDGLKARGIYDNTLWIVFGDHGEAFGQHSGNYGHTFFLYEENVHVPLVIASPGLTRGRTDVESVVSLIDVAPTILDLVGAEAPSSYQGRSLLTATPAMALFFTDYSRGLVGLRDQRWKLVHEIGAPRSQLFDMVRDPRETVDLAQRHPDRVGFYREHLLAWSAAQKDRVQRSLAAPR